jgi:hypothetical protein
MEHEQKIMKANEQKELRTINARAGANVTVADAIALLTRMKTEVGKVNVTVADAIVLLTRMKTEMRKNEDGDEAEILYNQYYIVNIECGLTHISERTLKI